MPNSTRYLRLLVILAAFIPVHRASAQRDDADWLAQCKSDGRFDGREKFCEVREVRMAAPGGTITVDGLRNGGVSVYGASRDSLIVKTRLQVQARSQSAARDIARQVRTVLRGSSITADGPESYDDDASWSASFIITAPRRSDLHLSAHNGPLSVEDVSGDMDLETHNGPIALRSVAGNVRARTTNGPLSITLTGTKWDGTGLDVETHNGPLSLSLPTGYSAHLEAETTNGPMSLGFPVTVVGRINKNISTDLGSGGATIRAVTHNGPLSIARR
jgi:Putative adhesin